MHVKGFVSEGRKSSSSLLVKKTKLIGWRRRRINPFVFTSLTMAEQQFMTKIMHQYNKRWRTFFSNIISSLLVCYDKNECETRFERLFLSWILISQCNSASFACQQLIITMTKRWQWLKYQCEAKSIRHNDQNEQAHWVDVMRKRWAQIMREKILKIIESSRYISGGWSHVVFRMILEWFTHQGHERRR